MSQTAFDSRLPPQAEGAERAVLGAMLLERQAAELAASRLRPDDFYRQQHATLFGVLCEMLTAGSVLDMVTVGATLRERDLYDQLGGDLLLAQVMESVPTAAAVEHYVRIVHEAGVRRRLIALAYHTFERAHSAEESLDDLLVDVQQQVLGLAEAADSGDVVSFREGMQRAFQFIERGSQRAGARTGLTGFDRMLGGLEPSDVVVLAAETSVGKTALALHIASHVAMAQQRPVVYFTIEMSVAQLALRKMCERAGLSLHAVRLGEVDEESLRELVAVTEDLKAVPLFLDDSARLRPQDVLVRARRVRAQHGLGLIVVDYLQLMRPGRHCDGRHLELAWIMQCLKQTARDLQVPVLLVSQLSRAVARRGGSRRPQLSDLRESGSIEEHCDACVLLYYPFRWGMDEVVRGFSRARLESLGLQYESRAERFLHLNVAKQRNGPTGEVLLDWDRRTMRFSDWREDSNVEEG